MRFATALGLLLLCLSADMARASAEESIAAICDEAGSHAARASGVPLPVLQAITLTETGRMMNGAHRPWPWTVNMEGVGKWFGTREEALSYVMEHYDRGARSFDVGCFQINYRWHGNAFASIEDMFDPRTNALYAGQFLRRLYGETQSWSKSAGAYHSRTPQFATRYSARFDRILAKLTGKTAPPPPAAGEYAHDMTEVPAAPAAPVAVPWVPPPPSKFGSLAAVDHLPRGQPLLTQARRGLY